MPTYKITDPATGKTIRVSGSKPPTQQDAAEIFSSTKQVKSPQDNRTGVQAAADFFGLGTTARNISTIANFGFGSSPLGDGFVHVGNGLQQATKEAEKLSSESFARAKELTDIAKKTTDLAEKKRLLDQARYIMQRSAQNMELFQSDIAQRQQSSGITEQDLQRSGIEFAARRGVGQTAELASYLAVPAAKGATTGARITQAGVRGATAGALQGVAGASRDAETVGEAATQVGVGAAAGGVMGAAVQGGIEGTTGLFNKILSLKGKAKQVATDMYRSTLKNNVRDSKFYKQYGGTDAVFKDSIKYGVEPTKTGVERQFEKFKPEYNKIITNETERLRKEGVRINVSRAFKKAKSNVESQFSHDKTLLKSAVSWFDANKSYNNATNSLPGTANKLRIKLDQRVGDILTSDAAPADAARKAFASELRKEFKRVASNETKDAIQKYHLLSGLSDAMQVEPKLGITEAAYAALSPGKGPVASLVELLAGKAIRSPGLRRSVAGAIGSSSPTKLVSPKSVSPQVFNPIQASISRAIENERSKRVERKKL